MLNDGITLQVSFVFPVWTQVLMGLQVTPEVGPPGRFRTHVKSLEGCECTEEVKSFEFS